jgi:integrase
VAVRIPFEGWVFHAPKTETGVRDIYFPAHVYRALELYSEWRDGRARVMGSDWSEAGLMFPSDHGTSMYANSYRHQLRQIAKEARIAGAVTAYTLRYSFATLGLLAGELDKTVSAQMGH